jgi:PAS domain S-box-containing protein
VSVLMALGLMLALDRWLNLAQAPFLLFFGAVVFSAWHGGWKSGLAAALLAGVLSNYFFQFPLNQWALTLPSLARTGLFVGQGVLVGFLFQSWRSQQLQEANALITDVLESTTDIFFAVDLQWRFTHVNGRFEEIMGRSRHELLGKSIWQEFPAVIGSVFYETYHRVMAEHVSATVEGPASDGSGRWFMDHIYRTPKGLVVYSQDISDRKKVEAAQQFLVEASALLASSLEYERTVSQLAKLAVPALADFCSIDEFRSDGTVRSLAVVSHQSEEQPLWATDIVRPFVQRLQQGQSIFYSSAAESLPSEIVFDRALSQSWQRLNPQSLIIVPLQCRGYVFGALSFAMTASGRTYQAADLALAEDVARRAATAIDNAQLYQEANRANHLKDEFLAILSHELRTPLNPILGWSKLLQSQSCDGAVAKRALETIERNAKLQAQLIDDLLDVSRILRGKLSLSKASVNLVEVIEAAIDTVRLSAEAKAICLRFEQLGQHPQQHSPFAPQSPLQLPICVAGDAARLQQVMWNLLSNAVKFTPRGGQILVELSILDRSASGLTPDQYAQIKVIDTGKGIQPQFLPYVFECFRQADAATTRKFGGLGLGLAIVRHIVELHGGRVSANSPGEDQGATFTVQLPLQPADDDCLEEGNQNQAMSSVLFAPSVLQNVRVLVVDDETDMQDFLRFVLQKHGAIVSVVSSAPQALRRLAEFNPVLLICDIGMPEVDGYMLMQAIRALPPEQGGQISAIALTAYATDSDRQKALSVGFQHHLAKPVAAETLIQTIVDLLQLEESSNQNE